MSTVALPARLKKEPLVDALFQIRFTSTVPASNVLPGLLFSKFPISTGAATRIERLPISDLPSQMRDADPFLKFQPLLKLHMDRFMILIGDSSITVACQLPYAGWALFKQKIIEIMDILKETHLIDELERYSMKYVDIIDGKNITEQINRTNIELKIGNHKLASDHFTVRVEIKRDAFINIVQIATSSSVVLASGEARTGLLIDVDTVADHKTADFAKFTHELQDRLDIIHDQNKTMFFECLTPETIEYLEPVYDTVSA